MRLGARTFTSVFGITISSFIRKDLTKPDCGSEPRWSSRLVISGEREGYSGDDHRGSDPQSGLVKSLRMNDEIVMPNTEVKVLAPSLIDQRVVAACQVTNRIL